MAGGERRKSINGCGGDERDYDDAYMLVHDDDGDGDGSANDDDFVYFSKSILLCIVVLCGRTYARDALLTGSLFVLRSPQRLPSRLSSALVRFGLLTNNHRHYHHHRLSHGFASEACCPLHRVEPRRTIGPLKPHGSLKLVCSHCPCRW